MLRVSLLVMALGVVVASSVQGQDLNAALAEKRQMIRCMNKQMSASRTISYNDATKICKADAKGPDVVSSTPPPPPTKPAI
jgi:hypothetical protein